MQGQMFLFFSLARRRCGDSCGDFGLVCCGVWLVVGCSWLFVVGRDFWASWGVHVYIYIIFFKCKKIVEFEGVVKNRFMILLFFLGDLVLKITILDFKRSKPNILIKV